MTEEASESILSVATAFALALDRDDFAAAEVCLARECVYESPDGVLEGPAAIIAAYRGNAESAVRDFDKIEYDSIVEPAGGNAARITYIDRITHQGKSHEYRCRQVVEVGDDGKIVHIKHEEIPGKREALRAFFDEVGIDRDS